MSSGNRVQKTLLGCLDGKEKNNSGCWSERDRLNLPELSSVGAETYEFPEN